MSVATNHAAATTKPSSSVGKKKTLKLRRLFQNIHPGSNHNNNNNNNHHHASLEDDDNEDDERYLFDAQQDHHDRYTNDPPLTTTSFDTRQIIPSLNDDNHNHHDDDDDKTGRIETTVGIIMTQPLISQPNQQPQQQRIEPQEERVSSSSVSPSRNNNHHHRGEATMNTQNHYPIGKHVSSPKKLLPENKHDSLKKQRPLSFRVRAPAQPISNVDPPPSNNNPWMNQNNSNQNSNRSASDVTESSIQLNPYARQVAIVNPYHRNIISTNNKNHQLPTANNGHVPDGRNNNKLPAQLPPPSNSSSASVFQKRTPVFEKSPWKSNHPTTTTQTPPTAQFFPPSTRDTTTSTRKMKIGATTTSAPITPTPNVEMQLRSTVLPPRMETPDIFDGLEDDEVVVGAGEEDDDKTARNHNLIMMANPTKSSLSSPEEKILNPMTESKTVRNTTRTGENASTYSTSSSLSPSTKNSMLLHRPGQDILKAALCRNFGREFLPKSASSYMVKVHPAEWDADHQWKYRILIQQQQQGSEEMTTTAMACRTVADFFWLEKALNLEYHGSLIIPILEIALSQPYVTAVSSPVEPEKLQDWLSDVLNHVRGNGEWMMTKFVDLVQYSQAVETFLYRRHIIDSPLDNADSEFVTLPKPVDETDNKGVLGNIMDMISGELLCTGGGSSYNHPNGTKDVEIDVDQFRNNNDPHGNLLHRVGGELWSCTSRANAPASPLTQGNGSSNYQHLTSSVHGLSPMNPKRLKSYTDEVIEAEQHLVLHYRQRAMSVMEKLQQLRNCEEEIGLAWKRFAASLEDLFRYEKTVETFKIGDPKIKNLPFRKVDVEIQSLAQAKLERSSTSLTILSSMMRAFIGDLCAVEPSVDTYRQAIMELREKQQQKLSPTRQKKADQNMILGSNDENMRQQELLLQKHEKMLRISLTTMCRTTPFRTARMAWRYLHTEASQCAHVNSTVLSLRRKLEVVSQSSISKMLKRHSKEEKADNLTEIDLIQRIVNLGSQRTNSNKKNDATSVNGDDGSTTVPIENDLMVEVDNDSLGWARAKALQRDRALEIGRQRIGRWDAKLAMAIMEAVGVDDPNVRVEETTKELRLVRKFAIGLREHLNKCVEAIHLLQEAVVTEKNEGSSSTKNINVQAAGTLQNVSTTMSKKESITSSPKVNKIMGSANRIRTIREEFLQELLLLFSGVIHDTSQTGNTDDRSQTKSHVSFKSVLTNAGIDTGDTYDWIPSQQHPTSVALRSGIASSSSANTGRVGNAIVRYWKTRDAQIEWLLTSMSDLLEEYYQRVEAVESFVYMECVGIQLEKHFSVKRAKALSAFEKKTDLTAAMNVATRKRMFALRNELQQKLDALSPEVSHTTVKDTKEAHLESKEVKANLHELALRRLTRARETSTERVVTLLAIWAKEEEIGAKEEIQAVSEALSVLEKTVCKDDVEGA